MSFELAWAAGFFDGEGHSGLSDGYTHISIAQTHPEVLERFQKAVGVGTVKGPYPRTGMAAGIGQDVWRYNAHSWDAVEAMDKILMFLSSEKTSQWEQALMNAKIPRRRGYCRNDIHEMTEENTMITVVSGTVTPRCIECRKANSKRATEARRIRRGNRV